MRKVRSDDALAQVASSVVLICGAAFFLVGAKLFFKWYEHFHHLGKPSKIVTLALEGSVLGKEYWNEFFISYISSQALLSPSDLRNMQKLLLDSGYFSSAQLSISENQLKVTYALFKPLAIAKVAAGEMGTEGEEQKSSEKEMCLYESGKFLPRLTTSSKERERPYCHLLFENQSFQALQECESIAIAAQLLKILEKNPAIAMSALDFEKKRKSRPTLYKCVQLDTASWLGRSHCASELVLGFEDPRGRQLFVRLGSLRLEKLKWFGEKEFAYWLELGFQKKVKAIDARLGNMVVFEYKR